MAREIQNDIGFLQEAKAALAELEAERSRTLRLVNEEKKLNRSLETERKTVEDTIETTIKKRKDEITDSYDREIGKAQDKVKKARSRREKAKNQGVKSRIQEETAQLKEENRQLKLQNVTCMRQKKIPKFCNTRLYYALFFTKGIGEALIFLLFFLLGFLVLPCGIYLLIPGHTPWMLIVIYVAAIFLFFGLYIVINNRTKVSHLEDLRDARRNYDMICANRRKIKVIIKAIEKDKNESVYNLGQYDKDIDTVEEELAEIGRRKQDALTTFENETKEELEREIVENNREKLETLAKQLQQVTASGQEASANVQQKTIEFTDTYGPYIGQEFLSQERLDKLIDILNQGLASNITEAQQIFKNVK